MTNKTNPNKKNNTQNNMEINNVILTNKQEKYENWIFNLNGQEFHYHTSNFQIPYTSIYYLDENHDRIDIAQDDVYFPLNPVAPAIDIAYFLTKYRLRHDKNYEPDLDALDFIKFYVNGSTYFRKIDEDI